MISSLNKGHLNLVRIDNYPLIEFGDTLTIDIEVLET